MSFSKHSRGPRPEDASAFGPDTLAKLQHATEEVGWLCDRRYARKAAGTLVGDHHQLSLRQRRAIMRCACGEAARQRRALRQASLRDLQSAALHIDGFNLLLTVEAALAGGVLLRGQDGCLRDMASLNGRFVRSPQTEVALGHIGAVLSAQAPSSVRWYFDRPVPFSGQLAAEIQARAEVEGWPWTAETVADPDPLLRQVSGLVATADGAIMEACRWVNLAEVIVGTRVPQAWIVDLSGLASPAGA